MPQTILDTRNYTQSRKCDVPVSNFVTLGGDSPTGGDSLNGFFPNGQTSKNIKGREAVDDKVTLSLSVLKNGENRPNLLKKDSDLDLDLAELLNGDCLDCSSKKNGDVKEDLFSDYLFSSSAKSLKTENMRIKSSESEILGDFSDLLASISSPKQNSEISSNPVCNSIVSKTNGLHFYKKSGESLKTNKNQYDSPLSDILSSISFEENGFEKSDCKVSSWNGIDQEYSQSKGNGSSGSFNRNFNNNDYNSQNNGTLSDILSSISFDENEPQKNNPSASNLESENIKNSTLNGLDSVFNHLDSNSLEDCSKQTTENQNQESLSDMLSSIIPSTDRPNNGEVFKIRSDFNGCMKSNPVLDFLVDFDINNTTQAKNISIIKPSNDQKNEEFSFFSVSPESGFSEMLSSFPKSVDSQVSDKNNSPGISMLDLFKSVNSDTSSLSEYLSSEGSSPDTNANEISYSKTLDIDLSSCVKTGDSKTRTPEDSTRKNFTDDFELDLHEYKPTNFFTKFSNIDSSSKRPRMNTKQSLFAKALSCKPKKNLVLLQKVEDIKSELFEKYFNAPFIASINPKKEKDLIENQSNCCMVTFHGRRVCSPFGLEDVK